MNVNVLDRATLRGRHGAPGAVPAADHPGLRLRRQLRPAHPRAAARRHQPHLPRGRCDRCRTHGRDRRTGPSTPGTSSTGVDGPGHPVRRCSSPAARCAACTARTPTPGTCATARSTTVDEVMARDRAATGAFIQRAGGGVTVTGGEPLLQPGVHRARCCAAARRPACTPPWTPPASSAPAPTDDLLADTDLVLLDIKSWDPRTYRRRHRRADVAPDAALRPPARRARRARSGSGSCWCPA